MARVASVTAGLALAIGLLAAIAVQSPTASAQSQVEVGFDVVSDGNGGTSISSVQNCTSVSQGDQFDVDIYVRNVEDLSSWETTVRFPSDKLQFIEADVKLFLQSQPGSKVLILANEISPGRHFLGATDMSFATESGAGVLGRMTLKATAPGLAQIDVQKEDVDGDGEFDFGTWLTASGGGHPGDTTGDGVYDGPAAPAFIAIDRSCSGVPTPGPDQGSGGSDPQPTATALSGSDNDDDPSGNGGSSGGGSDNGDDPGSGGSSDGDSSNGEGSGPDGEDTDGDGQPDDVGDGTGGGVGGGTGGGAGGGITGGDSEGSGTNDSSGGGSSGGISTTLLIAIAVAGAAMLTGFVLFGIRSAWRPTN